MKLTTLLLLCIGLLPFSYGQKKAKLSKKVRTSIPLLTEHVTKNCSSREEKIDSIYFWITSNIAYDYKVLESSKPLTFQGSVETLKAKKGVCNSYVELMKDMLGAVDVKSEYIE